MEDKNQNKNNKELKEVELTPEEKDFEDRLIKILSENLGIEVKPCGIYKLMFVADESGKGGVMMMVFLPSHKEGHAIAVDFSQVAQMVIDVAKEYMQKYPVSTKSVKTNERLMVI